MLPKEERREIAARLREHQYGDVRASTYEDGMVSSWLRLKDALGADGDDPQEDHTTMFGYLADLIEPEPECVANITFTAEQQEELFQRVMEELRVNVSLTEAVDAICGQMCGDGWDWRMRAETVVRTIAEMCGAKVVND